MAYKNVRERVRSVEQTYEEQEAEAVKALHRWINSHDEKTTQSFWRIVFYNHDGVKSKYPELMDALTGGIDHVMDGDWPIVREMYRNAPDEIIQNILKFSMPHPLGAYDDIQTDPQTNNGR